MIGRRAKRPAGSESAGPSRFVLVVTYGRSGSTLVQGLLNTLPGTLVRGENDLFVLPLFRAFAQVKAFRALHGPQSGPATSAFYGLREMKPAAFVASARQLIREQLLGERDRDGVDVLGFKEVLWHRVTPEETEAFFDYLDRLFPDAKYILNKRDHDRVVDSGFWQDQDRDDALAAVARVEEIQDFLTRTRPDRTLETRYELITSDDREVVRRSLTDLAEFVLGSCSPATLEQMLAALEVGHGPNPFGKSHGRRARREASREGGASGE